MGNHFLHPNRRTAKHRATKGQDTCTLQTMIQVLRRALIATHTLLNLNLGALQEVAGSKYAPLQPTAALHRRKH